MNRMVNFLTLFTSGSTLVCCALPALFVTLGAGATFAGIVTNVPGLIWISEHKEGVFVFGGLMLTTSFFLRRRAANLPCPIDPEVAEKCQEARVWSGRVFYFSVFLYLIGFAFAYLLPLFL